MPNTSPTDLIALLDEFEDAARARRGLNPWAKGLLAFLALPVVAAFWTGGVLIEVGILGLGILGMIIMRERRLAQSRGDRLDAARDALRQALHQIPKEAIPMRVRERLRAAIGDKFVEAASGPTEGSPTLP